MTVQYGSFIKKKYNEDQKKNQPNRNIGISAAALRKF